MHHFEVAFEKTGGKKNTLPPQVFLLVSRGSERHQTIPILDVIFEKQARGHTFALGYKLFVFGVGGREDKEEKRQKEDGLLRRITSGTRDGSSTMSMLSENYACRQEAERKDTHWTCAPVILGNSLRKIAEKEIMGWRMSCFLCGKEGSDIDGSQGSFGLPNRRGEVHILRFSGRFGFEVQDKTGG
jgi:hypothetical protein